MKERKLCLQPLRYALGTPSCKRKKKSLLDLTLEMGVIKSSQLIHILCDLFWLEKVKVKTLQVDFFFLDMGKLKTHTRTQAQPEHSVLMSRKSSAFLT